MKKTKIVLTTILLAASTWLAKGQSCSSSSCSIPACEYVCNGGFDYKSSTPTALNQLNLACGWTNTITAYTPDYYHSASTTGSVGIPCNINGNQSYQFDDGYAGLLGQGGSGWHEAIATSLKTNLTTSNFYEVSFYLSLADVSSHNALNSFGIEFVGGGGPYYVNTSSVTSTGWTKISYIYQAGGGEIGLKIGFLKAVSLSDLVAASSSGVDCYGNIQASPYYYLDNVSVREINQIDVSSSHITGCTGESFTLTASNANTYTYTPSVGSPTVGNPLVVTPGTTTIYTVTGTNSGGCVMTPTTITIAPYACCTNTNANTFTLRDVNLVANGTSGALPWTSLTAGGYYTGNIAVPSATTITNYTFTIVNTLTISTPVSFSVCNICVCEDDIIYQDYLTKIDRTWVWGDKLWEGINSKARLEVKNSFIEDAYQAINAGNVTTYPGLICDNVVFNRNFVGIRAAAAAVSPSDFNITGSIFTSRGISFALHNFSNPPPRYTTSLHPLVGKAPAKLKGSTAHSITHLTIRGHAGIVAVAFASSTSAHINIGETSGTPTTNASYTNYFDGLNGGIVNYWSRLFIKNNSFGNMINTGLGTAIGGVVHDDDNMFGNLKLTETKVGDATGGTNYKNIFNAMKDAVVGVNSGTLNVSGNDFINVNRYGVSVSTWSSSSTQLEPVTVSANSYTDCLYPFYAYDNNYIKATINTNTVTHVQPTYTAGYCAYINELSKPANGTYSITSNVYSGMLNGIYVTNTSGARIVGNTVTIKKPGTGVFNAGVTLANSDNTIVSDNILSCNPTNSGSWYTFGILGSTAASNTLQCNTITKSGICIKFQGSGSPNYIHNNSLNNASTDPCLFGVVLDQSANIGHIGHYNVGGSYWERSDDIWGDFLYGSPNNGADTYAYNNATGGNIYYDAGATAALYTPSVNLFTSPATVFTPVSNVNTNGNSCGIGARLANTETGGGKTVGSGVSGSDLNFIPKKRIILRNGNNSNKEINTNENSFYLVDSLLTEYIAKGDNGDLSNAKSTNASIVAANNIEQNQKDFNAIYAVYLQGDSIGTYAKIQDLIEMAKLCPFTDGLAVYQARALVRYWDDSTFFYNDCEINVPSPEAHARNVANALEQNPSAVIAELFPNPADNLILAKTNLINGTLEIWDVMGRKVLTQKLIENETKIDVSSFNNGTYLYKITDSSNRVVKKDKLMISH